MTHVIFLCCSILMAITVCESRYPAKHDCPVQMSISYNRNQSETGNSLENQGNASYTCSCVDESCNTLCSPTGELITNYYFQDFTPGKNISALGMAPYNDTGESQILPPRYRLVDMYFPCKGSKMVRLRKDPFERLENGFIYLKFSKRIARITDFYYFFGNSVYTIEECIRGDALVELLDKLSVGPVIISIPCLLLTFVVYSVVPKLRTMRGATLRGYIGPLAVTYTIFAVVSLAPEIQNTNGILCMILAILMYFFGLASFFWLNVMCFHIWWTFEKSVPFQGGYSEWERRKFRLYSIYAWGSASFFTGLCLVMDFHPNLLKSFARPAFGATGCFLSSKEALALYYYGPVGVTVVFNTLFFASTVLKVLKHQKENDHHLKSKDSQCHNANSRRMNIYLKFFIVMGINWLMDVASYICNDSPRYLWSATDCLNKFQGVIILVMFVLNKNIMEKIRELRSRRKEMKLKSAYYGSSSRIWGSTAAIASKKNTKLPHSEKV